MVTFTARMRVVPGKEEDAMSIVHMMVDEVEANEPGTLVYIAHRSQDDPQEIMFFEVYADESASKLHRKTPHMAKLSESFGEVFDADFGVKIEYFDRVTGFTRSPIS